MRSNNLKVSNALILLTIDIDDGSVNPSRCFCCETGDEFRDIAWLIPTSGLQTAEEWEREIV